jgi:hypothetical protein
VPGEERQLLDGEEEEELLRGKGYHRFKNTRTEGGRFLADGNTGGECREGDQDR